MMLDNVDNIVINFISGLSERHNSLKKELLFVAVQGGFARGTASEGSDIDIVICTNNSIKLNRYYIFKGQTIECRWLCYRNLDIKKWLERTRFVYCNETRFIYGDKDKYDAIIKECKMTDIEQKDILYYCLKRCGVRGIVVSENYLGRKWSNKDNYWIERNDLSADKLFLLSVVDYLIIMIYASNKQFTPSPKYKIYNLRNLEFIPASLMSLLFMNEWDRDEFLKLSKQVLKEIADYNNDIFNTNIDKYSLSSTLSLFNENKDF